MPSVRFSLPAPALRDLVTAYYEIASDGPLSDLLHPEWGNIRFSLAGRWDVEDLTGDAPAPPHAGLFGPTDRTRRFGTAAGVLFGVGLTPLGWLKLIGRDASELANAFTPLGAMLGDGGDGGDAVAAALRACAGHDARCVLLDALLERRADRAHPDERLAVAAGRVLLAGKVATIDGFSAALGVSSRTLNRLCPRVFGFGPKRLLRRQRFLRTLALIRDRLDEPLNALLDSAYYDQAHFVREFRAYMGMTPTAYFASPREVMRRAAAERQRVVGAPVQGLHGG